MTKRIDILLRLPKETLTELDKVRTTEQFNYLSRTAFLNKILNEFLITHTQNKDLINDKTRK